MGKLYAGLDVSMRATGVIVMDESGVIQGEYTLGWTAKERPCKNLRQRICYYSDMSLAIVGVLTAHGLPHEYWIAIEGYALHGPGDKTIAPELGGLVRARLVATGHGRIVEIMPSVLKKYVTGKGNARKDAMMLDVYKRWGYDCEGDDNKADAYALAHTAMVAEKHQSGRLDAAEWIKTTKYQRDIAEAAVFV